MIPALPFEQPSRPSQSCREVASRSLQRPYRERQAPARGPVHHVEIADFAPLSQAGQLELEDLIDRCPGHQSQNKGLSFKKFTLTPEK